MPGDLQPLAQNFKIVDEYGNPTPYFIQWAQQRQIDITAGITSAEAQQLIDDWAAARDVIAGAGLTGGGPLSNDVTLNVGAGTGIGIGANDVHLLDTAVTPGTYGDATHVGQFVVDQQGRVTGASNIAIAASGGGGSVFSMPAAPVTGLDTGGNACLGNIVIIKEQITVSALYGTFSNAAIGNVYNMFIATVNTANSAIIATVGTATPFTTTATGGQTKKFAFATPVVLTPGAYLFALVKTSSTTTSPCNSLYSGVAIYPNIPVDAGEMYRLWSTTTRAPTYQTNVANPSAVTPSSVSTTGMYAVGILFTMP